MSTPLSCSPKGPKDVMLWQLWNAPPDRPRACVAKHVVFEFLEKLHILVIILYKYIGSSYQLYAFATCMTTGRGIVELSEKISALEQQTTRSYTK